MGIISSIMKPVVFAAKNLFRNSENVTAARKALYGASKKGGTKKFESIFTNFVPKAKAGMKELSKEYKATKTTGLLKGIGSSFKNIWKTITSSTKAGVRAASIKSAGKSVSKLATFAGGAKGLFKGLGKCLKKLPVIGTILTVGFEIPEIYGAFKDGGFWEGTKQVLRSGGKLIVGAGCAALGTAIGGPVGGAIGWIAGDMLMDWIFPPYSEQKAKEEEQQTAQNEELSRENIPTEQERDQAQQQQQTPSTVQQPATPAASEQPAIEQPLVQSPITPTLTTDFTTTYPGTNPFNSGLGLNVNYPLHLGISPSLYGSFGGLTTPGMPITNLNPVPDIFGYENLYTKTPSNYKFIYMK